MNSNIYRKLAVTNLKNNGKSYLPYVLASAFSVMMYFIMDKLQWNITADSEVGRGTKIYLTKM